MRVKSILIGLVLAGMAVFFGCTTGGALKTFPSAYGGLTDAGFRVPPVPIYKVDPKFHRQTVPYATEEAPGTIIVDTGAKFLYYVLGDGQALRYGIGVGKAGFEWHGTAHVARKREWPDWSAPSAMIVREQKRGRIIPAHMEGGLMNPLTSMTDRKPPRKTREMFAMSSHTGSRCSLPKAGLARNSGKWRTNSQAASDSDL
ncbi:L,D-transpeptidase [Mesorhizobium sp. M0174]|uniref:L,D-transpeptidase n=1 Tax=Mesorhizobium sp. M0174 TaxID=2956904 RepID=UPI00333711EA